MKSLFLALAVCTSLPSFACKLDQPIDLSALSFQEGFESLGNAKMFPSLSMLFPDSSVYGAQPSVLQLTYPIDADFRDGLNDQLVLGARINLGQTRFELGIANTYRESVERSVEVSERGEIHTIKAYDTYYESLEKVPYVADMSIVKIEDNHVVSIEVGKGVVTRDRYPNPKKVGMKKTCVTSLSK